MKVPLAMKNQLLIISCLSISGCVGATRNCNSFDLPQAKYWTTVENVGETATFTSTSGKNLTMTLLTRYEKPPYEAANQPGASSVDEVTCRKNSQRRYDFGDGTAGLFIKFEQMENEGTPFEDQYFSIFTTLEAPTGTSAGYSFQMDAGNPETNEYSGDVERASYTSRVLRNTVFGGVEYEIAVEQIYLDTSNIVVPDGVEIVSGLVFAQGTDDVQGGLVRIDFANGESFTRLN